MRVINAGWRSSGQLVASRWSLVFSKENIKIVARCEFQVASKRKIQDQRIGIVCRLSGLPVFRSSKYKE